MKRLAHLYSKPSEPQRTASSSKRGSHARPGSGAPRVKTARTAVTVQRHEEDDDAERNGTAATTSIEAVDDAVYSHTPVERYTFSNDKCKLPLHLMLLVLQCIIDASKHCYPL